MRDQCADLGVRQRSWAPTSLGAVALGRAGLSNGFSKPLEQLLDGLPLHTLSAVAAHAGMLARVGCRNLGQVRALPRGQLSRRFDAEVLAALDQAYGRAVRYCGIVTLRHNGTWQREGDVKNVIAGQLEDLSPLTGTARRFDRESRP